MSLTVSLTPSLEGFVHNKVAQGEYESTSEVVREALRLFKRREELWQIEIRKKIDAGVTSLLAGQGIPAETVWAELESVVSDAERKHSTESH